MRIAAWQSDPTSISTYSSISSGADPKLRPNLVAETDAPDTPENEYVTTMSATWYEFIGMGFNTALDSSEREGYIQGSAVTISNSCTARRSQPSRAMTINHLKAMLSNELTKARGQFQQSLQ
ncbi:MAG: hypothetical protein AB1589_18380 [Cyanobacteriota bacterium]